MSKTGKLDYSIKPKTKGFREIQVAVNVLADFTNGTMRDRMAHAQHLIDRINLVLQENAEQVSSAQLYRGKGGVTIIHRDA